jgi:hypothetical protein
MMSGWRGCSDGACATAETRLKDGAQMNVGQGDETESSQLSATVVLREVLHSITGWRPFIHSFLLVVVYPVAEVDVWNRRGRAEPLIIHQVGISAARGFSFVA